MVPLKDIVPGAQNIINTQFILLEKDRLSKEGQEKTCLALVADETASVHFQLWGSECDAFEPGDIIRLTKGIFSYHRNNLVLRAGKRGKTEKIGEFTMTFVETPNLSEIRWVPDPSNSNKLFSHRLLKLFSRMAKSKGSIFIRLVSAAGTGFFYVKRKNPRMAEKLEFRKYDPRVNRHVLFTEAKMK